MTVTLSSSPADARRRRGLRRMRMLALGLLVLAAVVFALTHSRGGGWGFVAAASEAAMVGAIADWFAVTALFRHPLGLPIPHTAIIPRRKDALGHSLEEFVTENFLTEANARQRLATADVTRRFGRWLAQEPNARRVVDEGSPALARGLASVKDDEVRLFLEETLVPRLVQEEFSPVAGHLLESVVDDGAHHGLVDLALVEGHSWLTANHDTVAAVVGARAPWWSPSWLDDLVIDRVHEEALAFVADVRDRPDHPARRALDQLLAQLAADLQRDPATRARAEALAQRVLTHPGVGPALVAVWDAVRTALVEALTDGDGALRARLRGALQALGARLEQDDLLRARIDGHLADAVGHVVRTYGGEIATVISQTVDRWDGKEAAERIELHVGRDLQFIRINGTVVGALVGLVIHTLTVVL